MIVRVVVYEAVSMEAAKEWNRKRAPAVESFVGLDRVEFIRQRRPTRAGAIMYFESPEDLRRYKNSERHEWLQESMQESWAAEGGPVRDNIYRVMDLPENAAEEV